MQFWIQRKDDGRGPYAAFPVLRNPDGALRVGSWYDIADRAEPADVEGKELAYLSDQAARSNHRLLGHDPEAYRPVELERAV